MAEIRDAKLYRASHDTFEDYCKARWDIGRSRAYELIDQATVVKAITDAGVNLSAVADISKRDVRELKKDLPAAAKQIKDKIKKGAAPTEATAAVIAQMTAKKDHPKADRKAQQVEFDRQRDEARAKLPDAIRQSEAAKEAAIAQKLRTVQDLTDAERIAELEETVRILEGDIEKLKAENAKFGDMKVLFDQGGFEAVIAAKDEQIRVLNTRVSSESADKASWAKSAGYWKAQAQKLGYTSQDDIVIPLDGAEFGGVA
ncbi:hypothetical protein EOA75_11805 [Mesorhizobium sp. M1A.F.Ca.IN.022.07.1.1]|uniref:hypothetical protein n=1 Tax=Mesorhizobium sp. M1A.F.Ca.IN.022.07.1.1 TaxID=2496767 RepID=UPI000FCAC607|nr:hypothetical protein [Mesorhizobium sp. M1A.F.Ca.IN.022.07.1.1]RUV94332.1 hypothetical protein EOA75_11805 [Mesorhizobium sp. M1A.F.Ca.IN.022.07.1.1]